MRNVLLVLVLLLAGCASSSEPVTAAAPVSLGMSAADLRSYFGEPRRIETNPDGSARWFYRFRTAAQIEAESHTVRKESDTGLEVSRLWRRTKTFSAPEQAVHVSAEGFVVAPVPEGAVVRR